MVNEQINQESKNIPGCNSKQQKRGGSYFFAYYYENKKDKFSNLEMRRAGIFHTFFSLGKIFLTGKESREPWCFFSPNNRKGES